MPIRSHSVRLVVGLIIAISSIAIHAQENNSGKEAGTTTSCLNNPVPAGYEYRNPITIAVPPQATASVITGIAQILLEEAIGVSTNLISSHEGVAWPKIATGDIHALLEYWPSTSQAEMQKYFYDDQTITDAGPTGIVAQSGWYFTTYAIEEVPSVILGNFTDLHLANYFNKTLYVADEDWLSVQQDIIKDNSFELNIVQLPGRDELLALLASNHAQKIPMLFYFWTPHYIPTGIKITRVQLPSDAYFPSQILSKAVWSGLPAYSRGANYFFQAMSFSDTNVMSKMLAQLNNDSLYNITCNWIRNNKNTWKNWILTDDYQEVSMDLRVAMWILSGLFIGATIFYLAVTIKHRKSKVIIASSGAFLVCMCIGGILMFSSVIAFVSNTDVGCNIFVWTLPVGFALLFGSLFAKTGRIYLLFANKSLQLVKYTDRDVGMCVGVILLLQGIILTVMTIIQPAQYAFVSKAQLEYMFCSFHFPTGATLLALNSVVMIFGIIISILVGRLRLSLYNEAKYIGFAIYNFAFVIIFVVVIFLVSDLIVRYTLLCCCILFITGVSLSVIFIPKIRLLFSYTEEELREMNEAQLQAVIRSYTKKFATSSSDKKNSTNKTATTGGRSSAKGSGSYGSSYEDEMANLASNVKAMSDQIKELRAENKRLRETTSDDYRTLYEKYYHEAMIYKNQLFDLQKKTATAADANEKQ